LSAELARSELDLLAERWRGSWAGQHGFDSCCTPDVGYEDPVVVNPLAGLDALAAHAAGLRSALPDLRLEAASSPLGRGSNACLPWRLAGTHKGDTGALPATDRFVVLHGLHYVELTDGLVRRARGFFDLYDAATQLGLLPARGGLGETALLLLRGFGLRRSPFT
jgi:SnoaL-like polyketide cyclase